MTDLATLQTAGGSVRLRRAVRGDVSSIVELLVDDPLGFAREDAHRFYTRLGYVPSHEGFKLELAR